jgi:uncharacterized lipoprotein YajG
MRATLLIVCLSLLSACAFTDVRINPTPPETFTHLSGGDGREIVVLKPFNDERGIRGRCGMQKNSYNMDTASALCSAQPMVWLADLLAAELKAAGFVVKVDRAGSNPNAVIIEGSLIKFFVEPVIGFASGTLETDIHIRLVATSPNGLNAERNFFVKGSYSALTGMASNFQTSVDEATRKVVKDMVAAILSLMNRYPQLGINIYLDRETNVALRDEVKS